MCQAKQLHALLLGLACFSCCINTGSCVPELRATNSNEFLHIYSGTLPDVMGAFSLTQVFNVSYNSLNGTIPAVFSSLGAVNNSLVSCRLLLLLSTPMWNVETRNWPDVLMHIRHLHPATLRCQEHQSCILLGIDARSIFVNEAVAHSLQNPIGCSFLSLWCCNSTVLLA